MKFFINKTIPQQTTAPITERIKTFDDACNVLGVSGDIFTGNLNDKLAEDAEAIKAFTKLTIITRALNEGWKPDWNNSGEYKYYPWWDLRRSGFELYGVNYGYSSSFVGSRLCFKTEALAKYAAGQFLSLYKDFITLQ